MATKLSAKTTFKKYKYINYTWQHSHKPVHQSQPADHRLSHGHHHQGQAQTAAQQQKLINILYKFKKKRKILPVLTHRPL